MTGPIPGAGKQAGDLSHRSLNQVVAEVIDELWMLELEGLFKHLVNVGESNPKFGFQHFPISLATGGDILVR